MRAIVFVVRLLVSGLAALFVVPIAVNRLISEGVVGSWQLLPVCIALIPVQAAGLALVIWWPYRRLRIAALALTVIWSTALLSVPYWPTSLTPAELEAGIGHLDYDGWSETFVPRDYCSPWQSTWTCPVLSRFYWIDDGESAEVLLAIEAAGFHQVGTRLPAEPPRGSVGEAWKYEFRGYGLRMRVRVVIDWEYVTRLDERFTSYVPGSGEMVDIDLEDGRCHTEYCGLPGFE